MTVNDKDTALLLDALAPESAPVVHGALHQLGDLEMEVDGEGVATAIYLPPHIQVLNPQNILPPIEALEEARRDQLTEWLDSHKPDHPHCGGVSGALV